MSELISIFPPCSGEFKDFSFALAVLRDLRDAARLVTAFLDNATHVSIEKHVVVAALGMQTLQDRIRRLCLREIAFFAWSFVALLVWAPIANFWERRELDKN